MANAVLEMAKTGRSSCAMTGEPIPQGGLRVGFEIWRVGRRCMTYQTPKNFLARLTLSAASDGRSKCKMSGNSIKAADLCVAFVTGGAKGEAPTTQLCSLERAAPFCRQVATDAKVALCADKLPGFKDLSPAQQKAAAVSLKATASGGEAKKRPAAASAASSSKRQRTKK
eukprot:gb/GFBE01051124.1/.p1 GENE.gb/GFBE01051124.1/~~gb/GFBE01051124.1/.p1  ORF type:complete len:170 (+),score=39.01 gb/GFBE01051124.1/:1-510(+)